MSEIPKAYEPKAVEEKWYQFWCDQGCFTPDPKSPKPAYSIVIPPPNVTGVLHMGHVLNNTIQDLLARKARMDGKEVLWLPGTDHAGIATQAVVERALRKQGVMKHREDLGREKFLEHVWAWKEKHGGIIIQQLKKLGCSCDWTRERFTMDPAYSRCVQKVFVELYKKGLIYRGKRMVNWDPAARTALSDEEVEMTEEKGHLWHLKYPLLDDAGAPRPDQFVVVATTRPETMLGDEAVAVNPNDPRYTKLVGKKVFLPLQEKAIPVIADALVDPKFGTGCVKVTPAHDPADYEMAVRHHLPFTVVIGPDGAMTAAAGEDFDGMDRMEARQAVIEELTEQGLLLKTEDYVHNVGYSQRSHVPIEPYLSEQWFLKYPSVEQAIGCVTGSTRGPRVDAGGPPASVSIEVEGEARAADGASAAAPEAGALPPLHFHPDRWAKTYAHWMANLRDWCISRQLWWGHRVPVWSRKWNGSLRDILAELGGLLCQDVHPQPAGFDSSDLAVCIDGKLYTADTLLWDKLAETMDLVSDPEKEHEVQVCTVIQHVQKNLELPAHDGQPLFTQDSDVLDTWFSSWLWPFATMGWPEQTETLKKFYPTTDLVTGPDIIFFWVARMIMAGYEFMGDLPFRHVYFTGIIRDKLGRKMQKSLGNSPDPLDLIAKYGADALRFGTMRSAPLGQDVLFDEKDVELGRNFCNKLWNACRFRQMVGQASSLSGQGAGTPRTKAVEAPQRHDGRGESGAGTGTLMAKAAGEAPGGRQDACPTFETESEINPALLSSDDKWILLRLDQAIREMDAAFAEYKFSDATATLYRFFWSEYCDWYVEASKAVLYGADAARKANTAAVIDFVLSHTLRLFYPFLPFITEELWNGMGFNAGLPADQGGKTVMFARWPKPLSDAEKEHFGLDETVSQFVDAKYELVGKGRNLRREFNIASSKKVKFVLRPSGQMASQEAEVLRNLLNAESLEINAGYAAPKGTPSALSPIGELFMPLEGLIDVAAETARLTKEVAKFAAESEKVRQKLNNPAFVQKAPPSVLEEHQARLADWESKERHARAALAALGQL
jgi:valyl-tRNA synthetase